MAGMTPGGGWEVTGQVEGVKPDNTGKFVAGVTVSFHTNTGQTGSVFIPDTQYTPENVKRLVAAKADMMTAVAGLKG